MKTEEFIKKCEEYYHTLLSRQEFQDNFTDVFNHFLSSHTQFDYALKRKVIAQNGPVTLYHYAPLHSNTTKTSKTFPILIVYAFINRPSILDIQENRSFIKKLLEHHLDIYLLDWGNPRNDDKKNPLSFYIHLINKMRNKIPAKKINLMGICQGGTLSLCAASLSPNNFHSIITLVTPVDFQHTLLTGFLKHLNTQRLIGNIPGYLLSFALQSLKPFRFLHADLTDKDFFLRMEKWINDCPDHPGLAFHEFIYHFYQKNHLIKGHYKIDKKYIDLSQLKHPVLNIYAKQDHLVPVSAAKALGDFVGSLDYSEILFKGGHIGTFVSQKALSFIPASIAEFLRQ